MTGQSRDHRDDRGPLLVAGLGNPGLGHARNRHNVGYMLLDALANHTSAEETRPAWRSSRRFKGLISEISVYGAHVILLKPLTFMNLSGQSVALLTRYRKIDDSRLIVAHDDVDLEIGRIKLKIGGGDGGHRGLRSLISCLETTSFLRIRIGIGRPAGCDRGISSFVLSDFRADEFPLLDHALERAVMAISLAISDSFVKAMNAFNVKPGHVVRNTEKG